MGTLDRVRPPVDRNCGRSVRQRRNRLRIAAQGSLRDGPCSSAHGIAELLIRYCHVDRRSWTSMALLPNWAPGTRTLSDVRGLMVYRTVCDSAAARVSAS